jgi:hypothetical protein
MLEPRELPVRAAEKPCRAVLVPERRKDALEDMEDEEPAL